MYAVLNEASSYTLRDGPNPQRFFAFFRKLAMAAENKQ
jgi:hypothetical protein